MRRLTPSLLVELQLRGWSAPATVVSNSRDGVRLRLADVPWPPASPDLLAARLVFTDLRKSTTALDGIAQRQDARDVRWFPAQAALPSRRGTPRLRIALEASVQGRPATTIDLSTTGALVRCAPGPLPPEVALGIDVAGTRVSTRAQIVRSTPRGTAFRFLDLAEDHRDRIAAVVDVIGLKVAGG